MVWLGIKEKDSEMEPTIGKVEAKFVCQSKERTQGTEFKMQVVYCEPEEGYILREGYEGQGRLTESLMDSLRSSYQHNDDVLTEGLDEDMRPHKFYFYDNPLFVTAGEEIGQLDETVIRFGEGGHILFESMKTTQDVDFVEEMKEDEEVHWCELEQILMLNDGIGNSIDWMDNCKELKKSVFAGGQALKDDVREALYQEVETIKLQKKPQKKKGRP